MKSKTVLAGIILLFLGIFDCAYSMQLGTAELELEPYLKGGTIAWDRLEGEGGHKFLIAGGLNTNVKFKSLGTTVSLEKWEVAEGLDDDEGIIPEEGYSISADVKYFLKSGNSNFFLYPYTGVSYENWEKDKKLEDWKSISFFNWSIGIGLGHEKGYIKAALTKPFNIDAGNGSDPESRFGFSAESRIKLRSFLIGLFYTYSGFQDPDSKMTQSGLIIGYLLK